MAAIEQAEGDVSYDFEYTNGTYRSGAKPWAPKWLVDLIGVDYFANVYSVFFLSPTNERLPVMIWLLTTNEDWSAERPDIGYDIRVCEGEFPNKIEKVRELLKQEARVKLCRCFRTVDEAQQFVSHCGLRLVRPVPGP